jgi:AraC-like DNA-binding protein
MARINLYDEKFWTEMARRARYKSNLLSVAMGISQRQLQRYIKQIFGCTPHHWLNAQRIESAKILLVESRCAKVVCYDLGFKQPSHFSRQFKKCYGLSPSEFLVWNHIEIKKNGDEKHRQIQMNFNFMSHLDKSVRLR